MTIHITSLTQSEPTNQSGAGAPICYYCPICRRHTFLYSPYCIKLTDGDYFRMELCPDVDAHNWKWTKINWVDVQTRQVNWWEEKFSDQEPSTASTLFQ